MTENGTLLKRLKKLQWEYKTNFVIFLLSNAKFLVLLLYTMFTYIYRKEYRNRKMVSKWKTFFQFCTHLILGNFKFQSGLHFYVLSDILGKTSISLYLVPQNPHRI